MNSKLSMNISESFEGSKTGLSEKGLQKCIRCHFVPSICYWSPTSPTGLEMGTKGKHKVPSIGISSGNKIDEYLKTGRIKVFEAEYGIDFDGSDVEDGRHCKGKRKA